MDIYLKKAILHVVDREAGTPVISQIELDLTTEYIREYLTKKIQKLATPQTKTGILMENSSFAEMAKETMTNFSEGSEKLLQRWFDSYQQSEDAPSADVFIVLYEQDTIQHLAFLKVNYTQAFTHYVDAQEEGIANKLIINRAILGNKTQKADEGIAVNLNDLSYELIEKKYTFSGEKMFYFSTNVIETQPVPSLEENVKVMKRVAEKIGEKFEAPKHDVAADIKEAVYTSIEESGQLAIKEVAQHVFKDNITAQMAFQEEVLEKGVADQTPMLREVKEITEKKYGKQKLKLSNGIELIVPLDVYRNRDLIEFVNNPDGTISVTIKNVEDVINKL
ncbi:nucleoid-associated protein [Enterococcus mediterraneensis]|uniref:nucleoid-associated protein n=1 Tax=Enterococcus mediterraneensis TaxID=2364791 RepID=UPI000F068529|nr:nucleoid-associated protein [Enterococcus mediterraneensis]